MPILLVLIGDSFQHLTFYDESLISRFNIVNNLKLKSLEFVQKKTNWQNRLLQFYKKKYSIN